MNDIRNTEIWQKLVQNPAFANIFDKIYGRYYQDTGFYNLNYSIEDNKLILHYKSNVRNREYNCQSFSEGLYEFFLDEENNLVINELSGTLSSNYGYTLNDTDGGVLDTSYSTEVYDKDGIELAFQSYHDEHNLDKESFNTFKDGFMGAIKRAFNPNLERYANSTGVYPVASVVGVNAKFYRNIRSKDNLGIVCSSSCGFNEKGGVQDTKEEYYFNTFLNKQSTYTPEKIHVIRFHPFASIDENNHMHFDETFTSVGLTDKNYEQVAKERFLKELVAEKKNQERYSPRETLDKYDLMIEKMENELKSNERTM